MEAASSLSASLSKIVRGCFGFGVMDESGTSPRSAMGADVQIIVTGKQL